MARQYVFTCDACEDEHVCNRNSPPERWRDIDVDAREFYHFPRNHYKKEVNARYLLCWECQLVLGEFLLNPRSWPRLAEQPAGDIALDDAGAGP
ncbi:hypothetical protein [Aquamicrobium defluvii]|uniref:Uncharacterized protein n=1 Tax=Aquamicrobium defluvii TaxID=69279 RepID=A0A4R6YGP5_9HYPH|nr:hypothetical protein [Aquamicrobium defluvii]TDR35713.1 hypothetical protein DES43_108138 [Aquamicrobium defluvii]